MKKRVIIFGNGTLSKKLLEKLNPSDYIIGVDRAACWLLTQQITPDVAIGDFDSVRQEEFDLIKKSIRAIKTYPATKDKTDMELAIAHARRLSPQEVIIFGATGKRLDHTLSTLHMMKKHIVTDEYNRIRLIGRGKTVIEKASYRYISLVPYTKSITVSLTGFLYSTDRKIIKKGSSLGVSNEIIGKEGVIHLFAGKAWLIESND